MDQHITIDEDKKVGFGTRDCLVEDGALLKTPVLVPEVAYPQVGTRRSKGVYNSLRLQPRAIVGDANGVTGHPLTGHGFQTQSQRAWVVVRRQHQLRSTR
jgi:hypothetical protein